MGLVYVPGNLINSLSANVRSGDARPVLQDYATPSVANAPHEPQHPVARTNETSEYLKNNRNVIHVREEQWESVQVIVSNSAPVGDVFLAAHMPLAEPGSDLVLP
jgi:hypothetical protein